MTPKKVSRPLAEFGCRENWGESHLLLHSSLLLHQRESPNPRFPDQLYVLPFSGFRTIWAKMWFSHSFQFQIWIYQKNYFLNITLPHSILSFFFIAASLSSLRSSSIPIRPPSPRLHRLQPSWCLDKSIAMQTTVQQLSGYQCCALLNGRLRCLDTSRADETFAKLLTARPLPPKSLLDFQRQLFSLSAAGPSMFSSFGERLFLSWPLLVFYFSPWRCFFRESAALHVFLPVLEERELWEEKSVSGSCFDFLLISRLALDCLCASNHCPRTLFLPGRVSSALYTVDARSWQLLEILGKATYAIIVIFIYTYIIHLYIIRISYIYYTYIIYCTYTIYMFGCPVNRTFERANPTLLQKIICVVSVIE